MKFKISKLIALCLMVTLLSSSVCFAATPNVNVSFTPPGSQITTDSIQIPTSYVDLKEYGRMDFSGSAGASTLYLNQGFTGVTSILISVHNMHSDPLTVNIYRSHGWYGSKIDSETQVIPSGSYYSYSISGLDSDYKYYLGFNAPSDFEGYLFN